MIYLDNAATTQMYTEAVNAMIPFYTKCYSNPSEIYNFASESRKAINDSRKCISAIINAEPSEIYFTSGGTESDNWAVFGTLNLMKEKGRHIITTSIEHHAILNTCRYYKNQGCEVTYIKPDESGIINPCDIESAIRPDTVLISVMMANNEIGTIQPIKEIGKIARKHNILFHTDAVQAFCHLPIDVKDMNIDMLSASAHKCHGPKGVGFLYIRNGTGIPGFHFGGKQERTLRAGTENVAGIVGFGTAADIMKQRLEYNTEYITSLRQYFINRVLNEIKYVRLNGAQKNRLPGNASFCFAYLDGETIQIQLDLHGICCSTGSACNAGIKSASHVLESICVPEQYIHGSVRFTISEFNTVPEIDYTVDKLKDIVAKLRGMSLEYKMFQKSL